MRLQALNLLLHNLDIALYVFDSTRIAIGIIFTLLELRQYLSLIIKQHLQLSLDQCRFTPLTPIPLPLASLLLRTLNLLLNILQLPLQPHLLPLSILLRMREVRALTLITASPIPHTQPRQIRISKFSFPSSRSIIISIRRPPRISRRPHSIKIIINIPPLKTRPQTRRHRSGNPKPLMPIIQ